MPLAKALEIAADNDLNLVQMTEDETPVCKLMNYQKFLYDKRKAEKNKNKNKSELKEVKFNPSIADYDLAIKAKTASRILEEGDKVKVTITYKGRAVQFIKAGIDKLNKFETFVEHAHIVDRKPVIEGNRVYMIISPKK